MSKGNVAGSSYAQLVGSNGVGGTASSAVGDKAGTEAAAVVVVVVVVVVPVSLVTVTVVVTVGIVASCCQAARGACADRLSVAVWGGRLWAPRAAAAAVRSIMNRVNVSEIWGRRRSTLVSGYY